MTAVFNSMCFFFALYSSISLDSYVYVSVSILTKLPE